MMNVLNRRPALRFLLLVGVLCGLFQGISVAQSGNLQPAKSLVFRTLIGEGSVDRIAFCNQGIGTESTTIRANSYRRSPFYEYQGATTILFYDTSGGGPIVTREEALEAAAEGETVKASTVVGSVDLSDAPSSHSLLLFSKDPDAENRYRIRVIDESPARFPVDSVRLFNFTPDKYYVNINGTRTALSPGAEKDITPKDRPETGGILVRLGLERQDKIGAVFSRAFSFREGNRGVIFIRPGEVESGLPSISTIKDNPVLVTNYLTYRAEQKKKARTGQNPPSSNP